MLASVGYVVQGRAVEIEGVRSSFAGRVHRLLAWDEESPGAHHIPGTSWSQGRRLGLDGLRSSSDWSRLQYVVFMDADAGPTPHLLDRFEEEIIRLQPAVAVPVVERLRSTSTFVRRAWQLALETDEQVQAFRRELIDDFYGGSPYSSVYDDLSWWYPCIINQSAILRYLWRSTIQINTVRFDNTSHGPYPNRFDPDFIDAELRRLGLRNLLPFGAYERSAIGVSALLTKRRRRRIDRMIARSLAVLSPVLYRPWGRVRVRSPSAAFREALRAARVPGRPGGAPEERT